MKNNYRLIVFIIAIVFGLFYSAPSLLQTQAGKKVTLGLDLQGGLYMLLGVKTDEAIDSRVKSIASGIKNYSDKKDILLEKLEVKDGFIHIKLLDTDELKNLNKFLDDINGIKKDIKSDEIFINITEEEKLRTKEQAIEQAIETIRNRLDQFGLAEPTVAKQGEDKILVELAGIKSAEDEQRARELISRAAKLELMAVDEQRFARVNSLTPKEAASYGDIILPDVANPEQKYLLKELPILDGSMLDDATVGFNQNNRPVINFALNGEGAAIFGDFTGKNVGKRLAIVLDGKVYSAPVINERIGGGHGQISGNYSVLEAKDLAIALRSGALLAPIELLEKRSVGPSLGADSIKASMIALISGFVCVIAFMVIYYRIAGLVSNIALVVNILLILAVMSLFGATLTLPGMAGIVLTIGMAVDANVIINERIRELIREGVSLNKAIEGGYKNAMSSIVDSNITTLVAAIILYVYGTGAIKGFAITMSIGILASMLTAILGTHGIYQLMHSKLAKSKNRKIWFGIER
ncbi:MAG: protein translocase subunit SecD [Sulfurimonadaceae bacterium]|jgi:preprotein translocase subunit SecD|nr:protein translocase subunit SecD [Sulfurimonadaceae bacterium]